MKPPNIKYLPVSQVQDFVSYFGEPQTPETVALRCRGLRWKPRTSGKRDFGTINRYASLPSGITNKGGNTIYDPATGLEYQILVGTDSANNTRIFIDDGLSNSTATSAFLTELSQKLTCAVVSVSGTTVNIGTLKDILGNTYEGGTLTDGEVDNWIAYNSTLNNYAYISSNTANALTILNNADTVLGWGTDNAITLFRSTGLTIFNYSNGTTPHVRYLNQESELKTTFFYGDSGDPITARQPLHIKKGQFLTSGALGGGWFSETSGTNNDLTSVSFYDSTHGWAVGAGGVILNTTDGVNWNYPTTAPYNFFGVSSIDSTHTWIVGQGGKIYFNDGSSFALQTSGTANNLFSVFAKDSTHVWAVGASGTILFFNGTTWSAQTSGSSNTLNKVQFASTTVGYCVESLTGLLKTTDGGTTWSPVAVTGTTTPVGLAVASTTNLFVGTSDGKIFHSTDSGGTWTQQTFGYGVYVNDMRSASTSIAWAIGGNRIFYTSDSGTTWSEQTPTFSTNTSQISVVDSTTQYIVGNHGTILKHVSTSATYTIPNVWQIERSGGLFPYYATWGTQTSEKKSTDAAGVVEVGEGLAFGVSITQTNTGIVATTGEKHVRLYATLQYNGYEESDPVLEVFCTGTDQTYQPQPVITPQIDLAQLNKEITAINFYWARITQSELGGAGVEAWTEDPSKAVLVYTMQMADNGWTHVVTSRYPYQRVLNQFTAGTGGVLGSIVASNPISLLDALNHAPNYSRNYYTSRFGVKAGRAQNQITVIDGDDRTLYVSTYDGYGVHQDDNYTNVPVDNENNRQVISLQGNGTILGLTMMNQDVLVFRQSELEVVDIISGITRLIPIDCVSKNSITQLEVAGSPYGVVYAGRNGFWGLPTDGSAPIIINPRWKNFYDGTLMVSGSTTPYVNDAQRKASFSGYEKTYGEIYLTIQCENETADGTEYLTFRYNIAGDEETRHRWNVRKFNLASTANLYQSRRDGTLSIYSGSGILKYPNTGTLPYEDDVSVVGVTSNHGIPTLLRVNLGSIFDLEQLNALCEIIIRHTATVINGATCALKFYINGISTAYETKKLVLDGSVTPRKTPPIGNFNQLELQIEFDETLTNYKDFELILVQLGIVGNARYGNN